MKMKTKTKKISILTLILTLFIALCGFMLLNINLPQQKASADTTVFTVDNVDTLKAANTKWNFKTDTVYGVVDELTVQPDYYITFTVDGGTDVYILAYVNSATVSTYLESLTDSYIIISDFTDYANAPNLKVASQNMCDWLNNYLEIYTVVYKNLINIDELVIAANWNSDTYTVYSGYEFTANTAYTLSYKVLDSSLTIRFDLLALFKTNNDYLAPLFSVNTTTHVNGYRVTATFTPSENCYIGMYSPNFSLSNSNLTTCFTTYLTEFQVEQGSAFTGYLPYGVVPIPYTTFDMINGISLATTSNTQYTFSYSLLKLRWACQLEYSELFNAEDYEINADLYVNDTLSDAEIVIDFSEYETANYVYFIYTCPFINWDDTLNISVYLTDEYDTVFESNLPTGVTTARVPATVAGLILADTNATITQSDRDYFEYVADSDVTGYIINLMSTYSMEYDDVVEDLFISENLYEESLEINEILENRNSALNQEIIDIESSIADSDVANTGIEWLDDAINWLFANWILLVVIVVLFIALVLKTILHF